MLAAPKTNVLTLEGQQAVITGGNTGIGKAIALSLAAGGADIALNYIKNSTAAQETAHQIEAMGRRCIAIKGDVRSEKDVANVFRTATKHFGTIHIAVANAGIQNDAPLESMTLSQWQSVIETNLTGQFLCAREAAREYLRRGLVPNVSRSSGKILFISSIHQIVPWSGHSNYAASKAGGSLLMASLAQELAPHKIRVNGIAPGAIQTSINIDAWRTPRMRRQLTSLIPYGRIGVPEDIGNAAVWLLSDLSDYVVGSTIFVDGGLAGVTS